MNKNELSLKQLGTLRHFLKNYPEPKNDGEMLSIIAQVARGVSADDLPVLPRGLELTVPKGLSVRKIVWITEIDYDRNAMAIKFMPGGVVKYFDLKDYAEMRSPDDHTVINNVSGMQQVADWLINGIIIASV